jgi:putative heme-binding domain-containing protein
VAGRAAPPPLLDLARAVGTSDPHRRAAIDALARLGGPASREAIEGLCGAERPQAVRGMAAVALASLDLKAGAARAAEVLAGLTDGADPSGIVSSFLQRQGGPEALAAALAGRTLPADVAKLGIRAARTSGREETALVAALARSGGLGSGPAALSSEQMEQLVADVSRLGDPRRGEAVFRRPELGCLRCHAIAGAGGQVGPSLESLGASAPIDYLVDSILLPNKAVKENYHAVMVATDDGRILSGIKVRQSDSELVLRDAEDREVALALSAIEEQTPGGSLMPAGLADALTRGELIDLVRFLSDLGKVGPYAIGKARVVRRWQVLEPTPEAAAALRRTRNRSGGADDPRLRWAPAYSRVDGTLPLDVVPPQGPRDGLSPGRVRPLSPRRLDRGAGPIAPEFRGRPDALARRRPGRAERADDARPRPRSPHADRRHRPGPAPGRHAVRAGGRARLSGPGPGRRGQVEDGRAPRVRGPARSARGARDSSRPRGPAHRGIKDRKNALATGEAARMSQMCCPAPIWASTYRPKPSCPIAT